MRAVFKQDIKIKLICFFGASLFLLIGLFFYSANIPKFGLVGCVAALGALVWGTRKIQLLCYVKKRQIYKEYFFLGLMCYRDIFPIGDDTEIIFRKEVLGRNAYGVTQAQYFLELKAPDMKGLGGSLELMQAMTEKEAMRLSSIAKKISEKLKLRLSN